jgi:glycosyltransferase involved in cell wall biosynthesis
MADRSYVVLIPCKDGQETIEKTLQSILSQTIAPKSIIVVDDASTDNTPRILEKYPQILTIRLDHNLPRDFARVPKLVNLMLNRMPKTYAYVMISGDDSVYPTEYIELILREFERDAKLLVCSGTHIEQKIFEQSSPHGSGRIIKYSFLKKVIPFPESIGWESWVLFKALQYGGKVKRVAEVRFEHLKPYSSYSVWTFGQSMYELGYPFWFVLGRFAKNSIFESNKMQQLSMIGGFVEYRLERKPRLDVADFVTKYQKQRIQSLVRRLLRA